MKRAHKLTKETKTKLMDKIMVKILQMSIMEAFSKDKFIIVIKILHILIKKQINVKHVQLKPNISILQINVCL